MRGVHGKPSTGRGVHHWWGGVSNLERGDTVFQSIYGLENGQKIEKMAKIEEIEEKSHDPSPAKIMLFGATNDLLKIKMRAKMHQTMQTVLFTFFCSCYTILLISLLLEKKHAATLHGTTSLYY